jgi:hypothetical protein
MEIVKTSDGRWGVKGKTFDFKDDLKEAGGRWDSDEKMWIFNHRDEEEVDEIVSALEDGRDWVKVIRKIHEQRKKPRLEDCPHCTTKHSKIVDTKVTLSVLCDVCKTNSEFEMILCPFASIKGCVKCNKCANVFKQ